MTDYPMLTVEPIVNWGPGWLVFGGGDQQDLDAALAIHELSMDGDTVASVELRTSAGVSRSDIGVGIELTRADCLALAKRLLDVVEKER